MKTILFFTFDHFYPSGGANDFRRVAQIDGDFKPELIFEQKIPLNREYVTVVVVDEEGRSSTHQYRVAQGVSPDDRLLSGAVALREIPRDGDDCASSWVGLVPWTIY